MQSQVLPGCFELWPGPMRSPWKVVVSHLFWVLVSLHVKMGYYESQLLFYYHLQEVLSTVPGGQYWDQGSR